MQAINENTYSPTVSTCASYEFAINVNDIGIFVGRGGHTIKRFQARCSVSILIKENLQNQEIKIVRIEGTTERIYNVLRLIRSTFISHRGCALILNKLDFDEELPLANSLNRVTLDSNIATDVLLAHIVSPSCLFVYNYRHGSYKMFERFHQMLFAYYSANGDILPPLHIGLFGVACTMYDNKPRRIEIVDKDLQTRSCVVRYLDYGGYDTIPFTQVRRLHDDYLHYPVQAIECRLSGIQPLEGEPDWSTSAINALNGLIRDQIVYVSQDALDGNVSLVKVCKRTASYRSLLVNNLLVRQGFARRLLFEGLY